MLAGCAGKHRRKRGKQPEEQAALDPPHKLPAEAAHSGSIEDLIPAAPEHGALQPDISHTACAEPQTFDRPAASITPGKLGAARPPPPAADSLAGMFQDLEGQAAVPGLQCSPAQAPRTPELTACQPASCSSASSSALSDDSLHSQRSACSFASEEGQQKAWYLPSSTRVDADDLQQPASGPCLLGQGGMGSVSLMHDTLCDRMVAVKAPLLGKGSRRDCVMAAVESEHAVNELLYDTEGVVQYLGPVEKDGQLTGTLAFWCMAGSSLASNMCASPGACCYPVLWNLRDQHCAHAN